MSNNRRKITNSRARIKLLKANRVTTRKIQERRNPHLKDPTETQIGTSTKTGQRVDFHKSDRRETHTHIIGASRYGKSKLMEHLIRQDIINGEAGLCLIDPHGTLYYDILQWLSVHYKKHPEIAERVVLFEPSKRSEYFLGFNPIPPFDPYEDSNLTYLINTVTFACLRAWNQEPIDAPRVQRVLDNLFHIVIERHLTIAECSRLLFDHDYRKKQLSYIEDYEIQEEWDNYLKMSNRDKQTEREGAWNRLKLFVKNTIIKRIISQPTGIKFSQAIEEGKIILMNLNGENRQAFKLEQTRLLSIFIVNEILRVGTGRDEFDPNLKPFYVYIDEVGEMPSDELAYALSAIAKRKILFTLAHQYLNQIKIKDPKDRTLLHDSMLGNCQNKIIFGGLYSLDAETMSQEIPELVDLHEVKRYNNEYAYRIIDDYEPVEQIYIEESHNQQVELALSIKRSLTESSEIKRAKQQQTKQQATQTDTRSQAENLVNVLTNSETNTHLSQLLYSLAESRVESTEKKRTENQIEEMKKICSSINNTTDTDLTANSIAKILTDSETQTNIHNEGKLVADIASIANVKDNRQIQTYQVQNLIADMETQAQIRSQHQGKSNTNSQFLENSHTDSNVESAGHFSIDKTSDISSQRFDHGTSYGTGQQDSWRQGINTNTLYTNNTNTFNTQSYGTNHIKGKDRGFQQSNSQVSADSSRQGTNQSYQASSALMDTIAQGINRVKQHGSSDIYSSVKGESEINTMSQQEIETRADVESKAIASIIQQNKAERTEKIKSIALSEIEAKQESKGLQKVYSQATREMESAQTTESIQQSRNRAIAQIQSQQQGNTITYLQQCAIAQINSNAQMFSESLTLREGHEEAQNYRYGAGRSNKVTRSITKQRVERHVEYIKRIPEFYHLEEQLFRLKRDIKVQNRGYAFVKRGTKSTEHVKIDYVESVTCSRDDMETFFQAVVDKHPNWYVKLKRPTTKQSETQAPIKDISPDQEQPAQPEEPKPTPQNSIKTSEQSDNPPPQKSKFNRVKRKQ